MNIKNVSVIGAGQMGNGIAHIFAQAGFKVTLVDLKQNNIDPAGLLVEETQKTWQGIAQQATRNFKTK